MVATRVFEASFKQGGVWHIRVSRYREIDVEGAPRFSRVELHRDTADEGVRNALTFKEICYETKRLLFGISAGQAHGFTPQIIECVTHCQAVL
jgi:hypothetical protein